MHPLFTGLIIIFAVFCAVVVPLWLLAERRKRRENQLERKNEERHRLRRLVHDMRKYVTLAKVQDVRETCDIFRLQFEDIGTTYSELGDFLLEAHHLEATKFFSDMCKGHQDPLLCISKIIEHLHHAGHPHDWDSIETTWSDLRDLYHRSLIARARQLNEQMKRGDVYVKDPHKEGEIEALLILANATKDDLYPPSESDLTKKA
jgi:hypothetical protein